jgi:hypothetical protein
VHELGDEGIAIDMVDEGAPGLATPLASKPWLVMNCRRPKRG